MVILTSTLSTSRNFGFTNLSFIREGKENRNCRGEEHEIQLVWSVHSGKTRVYWNGTNISHYFRQDQIFEEVNFSWQARSGETFNIVALEKSPAEGPQYDLLVDGKSFFSFPRISQLRAANSDDVASDISLASSFGGEITSTEAMTEDADDVFVRYYASSDPLARKQTPDINSPSSVIRYSLEDELTSELFSNNLESLRNRTTSLIPGVEDIVSRAIINAFSEDRSSSSSFSSCSFESNVICPIHIESNVIWDTLSWLEHNVNYAPRPDVEEHKRLFLQKQTDTIFTLVRKESLTEDEAIRILCNIAALLGLEINGSHRRDTILIQRIKNHVDEEDVVCSLGVFGDVVAAHVSRMRKFGICRFRDEASAAKALLACATGTFKMNGESPELSLVCHDATRRPSKASSQASVIEANSSIPQPSLNRRKSHQRNSIIIDTASAIAPFLTTGDSSSSIPSHDHATTLLQPNVFANIQASQSSPAVFDSPRAPL